MIMMKEIFGDHVIHKSVLLFPHSFVLVFLPLVRSSENYIMSEMDREKKKERREGEGRDLLPVINNEEPVFVS